MFADALRRLDENTVNYMIEELRAEIKLAPVVRELEKEWAELKLQAMSLW